MERSEQLRGRLRQLNIHIEQVCAQSDRDPRDLTVVVVTKTWPASDIRRLADLGVVDVGENKAQELASKAAECEGLNLRWHFIGQLQTNKAAIVARAADCVHSVDRARLVTVLAKSAVDRPPERPLDCLIQVSLDTDQDSGSDGGPDPSHRGGIAAAGCDDLASLIAAQPSLRLRGVMGVAPVGADAFLAFTRLKQLSDHVVSTYPDATWMSAGMSGDLDDAIRAGATHLRVGSAILGDRPYLR